MTKIPSGVARSKPKPGAQDENTAKPYAYVCPGCGKRMSRQAKTKHLISCPALKQAKDKQKTTAFMRMLKNGLDVQVEQQPDQVNVEGEPAQSDILNTANLMNFDSQDEDEENDAGQDVRTSTSWLTKGKYAWLQDSVNYLQSCMYLGQGKQKVCRMTAKVRRPCDCCFNGTPSKWTNIYVEPPDPLMVYKHQVKPEHFQSVRTYFWLPELFYPHLVTHMPCKNCGNVYGNVKRIGWNRSGPRRVCAVGREYDVICQTYRCKLCSTQFQGYDQNCLSKLPQAVQQQFPCQVLPKTCVDLDTLALIKTLCVNKVSFDGFRDAYKEVNMMKYWKAHSCYVDCRLTAIKSKSLSNEGRANIVEAFVKADDKQTWNMVVPSHSVVSQSFATDVKRLSELKTRDIQSLTGTVLKGDHTFKIAKVPFHNGQHTFEALYSLMNESNQIIGYWMTASKSLSELEEEFSLVAQRYVDGTGPALLYTDMCCPDRVYFERAFKSLSQGLESNSLQTFEIPKQMQSVCVIDPVTLELLLEQFVEDSYVGFDAEWNSFLVGNEVGNVAVVILCNQTICLIVQLTQLEYIPAKFTAFLAGPTKKVGVASKGDATRLLNQYGIQVNNVVDVQAGYKDLGASSTSMSSLIKFSLNQHIKKDGADKFSDWEVKNLSQTQVKYATEDGFASFVLYQRLEHLKSEQVSRTASLNVDPLVADVPSLNDHVPGEVDDEIPVYQRVLLDPMHLIQRYPVSLKHHLHKTFAGMMKEAIFVNSEDDIKLAKEILKRKGLSDTDIDRLSLSYFISKGRVRRFIPEASIVASKVDAVVQLFRQIAPGFITDQVMKVHKNCMQHLTQGCLSDHPDVNLYTLNQASSEATFQMMSSARGTSQLECFHLYVAKCTGANCMSPLMANYYLLELVHRWNRDQAWKRGLLQNYGVYDDTCLEYILKAYTQNKTLFQSHPVDFYKQKDFDTPLEKFGCERIVNAVTVEKIFNFEESGEQLDSVLHIDQSTKDDSNQSQLLNAEVEVTDQILSQVAKMNIASQPEETYLPHGGYNGGSFSKEFLDLIGEIPYPQEVKSNEEVQRFINIFAKLASKKGNVDMNKMNKQWNFQLLQECKNSHQPKELLKSISFKTVSLLNKFKNDMEKKLAAREQLGDHWFLINNLRNSLRQSTWVPQPPLDPKLLMIPQEIRTVPESDTLFNDALLVPFANNEAGQGESGEFEVVQDFEVLTADIVAEDNQVDLSPNQTLDNPVQQIQVQSDALLDAQALQRQQHMVTMMDDSVQICPVCYGAKFRQNERQIMCLTEGHTKKTCSVSTGLPLEPTNAQINYIKALRKQKQREKQRQQT